MNRIHQKEKEAPAENQKIFKRKLLKTNFSLRFQQSQLRSAASHFPQTAPPLLFTVPGYFQKFHDFPKEISAALQAPEDNISVSI